MKWTEPGFEPAQQQRGPRNSVLAMIAELRTQPGRWAEVATYTPDRLPSARSRGSQTVQRYPELQYAVERSDDGTATLYFRVYDVHTDTEETS